ncbi:MAG: aminomethyl-transferring glycine dehydrogenase subunit GcvPB [Methanomassiliicoccales archaeon]|nr:aminomethyl-transferring glycine dehydrogenase subunit GcvPB [Methanomassiliicoccales archaeon]
MYRQAKHDRRLIMEKDGSSDFDVPFSDDLQGLEDFAPAGMLRESLDLPSLPEREVVKHYVNLSQMNFSVDNGLYPLGSCTMKFNPKYADVLASLPTVAGLHPYQDEDSVQGALRLLHDLELALCEVSGMDAVTLQPAAGAHGEFTGMLLAKAYHAKSQEPRTQVVVPDSAHGTNPSSAAMAGFEVIEIPSGEDGCVDLEALRAAVGERTAALMITNPNTLGIFESQIREIAKVVHEAGALLYYDGANLNAVMGRTSPGAMDFDIVHFNLHKTFATPHGGGGPGAGPVGVRERLVPFLPVPRIVQREGRYRLDYDRPDSIGTVRSFYGNFAVLVRAYSYILRKGADGLQEASERAVLNSNYLKRRLAPSYPAKYKELRKHEFVVSCKRLKEERGVRALDVGKRLLDYGYHAPTIYFPALVEEALMIEPTETETRETLDQFAEAMLRIAGEDPELVRSAPHNASVRRVDEVFAAKEAILSYRAFKRRAAKSSPKG